MESSAAATWLSAWVSTPPVIARVSTMVNAIPFLCVEGWHAPAGRRTCETPASSPGQADQTGRAGGCRETLDPGRQIVSQDNPSGVSRFGGQAGTQRPLTLRPHHHKTGEAGPEALIHILPADYERESNSLRSRSRARRSSDSGHLPGLRAGAWHSSRCSVQFCAGTGNLLFRQCCSDEGGEQRGEYDDAFLK